MNNHGNKGNTGKTETKHRKQNRTTHDSMPTEDEGGRVEEDVEQAKGKKPGQMKEGETSAAMKVEGAREDPGAGGARRDPKSSQEDSPQCSQCSEEPWWRIG